MSAFLIGLCGSKPPVFFAWAYFYASLGIVFYKFIRFQNRETKYEFNLLYWLKDNWKEILINIMLIYFAARFTPGITALIQTYFGLPEQIGALISDTDFLFLGIGVFHQVILQKLRDNTNVGGMLKTPETPPITALPETSVTAAQ